MLAYSKRRKQLTFKTIIITILYFLGFCDLWCFIRCILRDNNRTCYGCVVIDKSIKIYVYTTLHENEFALDRMRTQCNV